MMRTRTSDHWPRHVTLAAAVLVACGVVLAGCTGSSFSPSRSSVVSMTTQPSFTASTAHVMAPAATFTKAAGTSTSVDAAEHWLVAYHSMSWTDGNPSAWIGRVRPYVTAALDARDQQYADAGGGVDWPDFVAKQCTNSVSDLGAVIPSESPGTATAVNIQVIGTVTTICDAGQPGTPTEAAAATVVVIKGTDGSWRVDQRLY